MPGVLAAGGFGQRIFFKNNHAFALTAGGMNFPDKPNAFISTGDSRFEFIFPLIRTLNTRLDQLKIILLNS